MRITWQWTMTSLRKQTRGRADQRRQTASTWMTLSPLSTVPRRTCRLRSDIVANNCSAQYSNIPSEPEAGRETALCVCWGEMEDRGLGEGWCSFSLFYWLRVIGRETPATGLGGSCPYPGTDESGRCALSMIMGLSVNSPAKLWCRWGEKCRTLRSTDVSFEYNRHETRGANNRHALLFNGCCYRDIVTWPTHRLREKDSIIDSSVAKIFYSARKYTCYSQPMDWTH